MIFCLIATFLFHLFPRLSMKRKKMGEKNGQFIFFRPDLFPGGKSQENPLSSGQRSDRAKRTSLRYETTKRRSYLQHFASTRCCIFSLDCETSRRSVQPKLRRGRCPFREHAQFCRFLQRGQHQQSGPRVPQISQRSHFRL